MADPILKTSVTHAVPHFERAGAALAMRQTASGPSRGNVASWPGCADQDFHGTLAAIWVWTRYQVLSTDNRFASNREAAWAFIASVWRQYIPEAIGPEAANDEAAYDCAMALRVAISERGLPSPHPEAGTLVAGAARVLAAHVAELDDLSGRDFQDPGFMAWNLIDYARALEERGLLSTARRFVERAFGMKAPPPFASEPDQAGRVFDFSSTTATRVQAIISSEGNTPFVGAWLRERVVAAIPVDFVPRQRDENCWNACAASVLGRAYVVSTDPRLLQAYRDIVGELAQRDSQSQGGLGRGGPAPLVKPGPDTLATFYYALAVDSLVPAEAATGASSHPVAGSHHLR